MSDYSRLTPPALEQGAPALAKPLAFLESQHFQANKDNGVIPFRSSGCR